MEKLVEKRKAYISIAMVLLTVGALILFYGYICFGPLHGMRLGLVVLGWIILVCALVVFVDGLKIALEIKELKNKPEEQREVERKVEPAAPQNRVGELSPEEALQLVALMRKAKLIGDASEKDQ